MNESPEAWAKYAESSVVLEHGPLRIRGKPGQVGDGPYRLGRGEVADAAVEVEAELPGEHVIGAADSVADASLLQDGHIQLVGVAAERLPSHLDVAVRGHVDRRGRCRLPDRQAKGPAA